MQKPPSPRKRPHQRYVGPTRFAEKYGQPQGGIHDWLKTYLPEIKSGLTPVTPTQFLDNQNARDDAELSELYQRMRFSGFTAAELESVLALPDSYETTSRRIKYGKNLDDIPIHPLYDRAQWQNDPPRHMPPVPLGDGNQYWEAKNDAVWRAMEPAIKLASSILANMHTWEWFNALLQGPWAQVPENELPPGYVYKATRFFTKENRKDPSLKSYSREILQEMTKTVYFVVSGSKCMYWLMPQPNIFHAGMTGWSARRAMPGSRPVPTATIVYVAFELIEPLMNPKTLPEDRALDTFRFAENLLHETAHAIVHHMSMTRRMCTDWYNLEPYFENEPIPEAGFSASNYIFGGIHNAVVSVWDIPGVSSGGMLLHNWPSYKHENYTPSAAVLSTRKTKDWDNATFYPIPVSYYMSLQSKEFWEIYVRKYGPKAAHGGPKIIGLVKPKTEYPYRVRHNIPVSVLRSPRFFSLPKTKIAYLFDDERNRMIRKIDEASRTAKPSYEEPKLAGLSSFQPSITSSERADPVQMDCPRYDEIRIYLEKNKFALAIHTMDFILPAHVFLSYIVRHGGIDLKHKEWKTFLLVANTRHELFYHAGYGMILVNPAGWAQPPLQQWVDRPMITPPDQQLAEIFDTICRHELYDLDLTKETKEFDSENIKWRINYKWKLYQERNTNSKLFNHPKYPNCLTLDKKGDALLDSCVEYSPYFAHAPLGQGIIRRAHEKAPGIDVPKKTQSVHETLTTTGSVRLDPVDILGEDATAIPPSLRPGVPIPTTGLPTPVFDPFKGPSGGGGGGGSQPPALEIGQGTSQLFDPGVQTTQTYQPYRPPGSS